MFKWSRDFSWMLKFFKYISCLSWHDKNFSLKMCWVKQIDLIPWGEAASATLCFQKGKKLLPQNVQMELITDAAPSSETRREGEKQKELPRWHVGQWRAPLALKQPALTSPLQVGRWCPSKYVLPASKRPSFAKRLPWWWHNSSILRGAAPCACLQAACSCRWLKISCISFSHLSFPYCWA